MPYPPESGIINSNYATLITTYLRSYAPSAMGVPASGGREEKQRASGALANGTDPIVQRHISIRDRLRNHAPPSMRIHAAGQAGRENGFAYEEANGMNKRPAPDSKGNPFQPRSARNSIPVRRLCAIIRPVVGRAGLQMKDCSLMEQIPRQQAVSPITHDTEENRYALRKRHSPLDRRNDKPEIRYCNAPPALQSQRKER